jgi:hypothetical protein
MNFDLAKAKFASLASFLANFDLNFHLTPEHLQGTELAI